MEKKIGKLVVAISIIALVVGGAAQADLGPITVPNFSFEQDINGDTYVVDDITFRVWDINPLSYAWNEILNIPVPAGSHKAAPMIKACDWIPTDGAVPGHFGNSYEVPDGVYTLLLRDYGANEMSRTWQILPGESIVAGAEYKLTYNAAGHNGMGSGIIASLVYDDGTLTSFASATDVVTKSDADGLPWNEFEFSYVVPLDATYAGQEIGIQFQTDSLGGVWSCVDNVRLEIVPEPATMVLLGLGSLAMLRRRRA